MMIDTASRAWIVSTFLLLLPTAVLLLASSDAFTLFHPTLLRSSHDPIIFGNPTTDLDNKNQFRFFQAKKLSSQNISSPSRGRSKIWSFENDDIDNNGVIPEDDINQKDTILEEEAGGVNHKTRQGRKKSKYVLGDDTDVPNFWNSLAPADKGVSSRTMKTKGLNQNVPIASSNQSSFTANPSPRTKKYNLGNAKNSPVEYRVDTNLSSKTLIANDAESLYLSRALWSYGKNKEDNNHNGAITNDNTSHDGVIPVDHHNYDDTDTSIDNSKRGNTDINIYDHSPNTKANTDIQQPPPTRYEDIDLSIPLSVYNPKYNTDYVWDLLRYEAECEAEREPLLVSFLYSTILNHPSLESSLAFHLANRLSSPSMMSTQIMSLVMEALNSSPTFGRDLRADIMAVRDRDPACTCLPDVFLHFKGFHALETHRVANFFWETGRKTLAHYLQSQVSQNFQIDIHPNATLKRGIMLDHGTGIVIGETAVVGDNCSILHHVTLGGSGKRGVDRHPKVGNGVLLGAGASVLGNIRIGDGCQVGAGTLVIGDLPAHSVAVGVPAKVIGKFRDEEVQPARSMNQVGTKESEAMLNEVGDGI